MCFAPKTNTLNDSHDALVLRDRQLRNARCMEEQRTSQRQRDAAAPTEAHNAKRVDALSFF